MSAEGVLVDPALFRCSPSLAKRLPRSYSMLDCSRNSRDSSSSSFSSNRVSMSISSGSIASNSSNENANDFSPVDDVIVGGGGGGGGGGGAITCIERVDRNSLFQEYCDLLEAYVSAGGFQYEHPSSHEKMMYTARQHLTWMIGKTGHGRSVRFKHIGRSFKKHFQLLSAINDSENIAVLREISRRCLHDVFESDPYDPSNDE